MSNKKPTMNEMKTVVSNVIVEMKSIYEYMVKMDRMFFSYIEMNEDHDKFIEFMKKKATELEKETANDNGGNTSKGNKKTKKSGNKPRKSNKGSKKSA